MTPDDDIQIPDEIAAGLRSLHAGPNASPSMDARVLKAARRELAPAPLVLRPAVWTAAAAAVALGVSAWMLLTPSSPTPVYAREDVDLNGRVDMLDAFTIARAVDRGQEADPAWDLNDDGVVDRTDADIAAMVSVRLEGESS